MSRKQSELFGVIPYIDPKKFQSLSQPYSLNKKSDVYSIGVLLWELSSGRPPFCSEGAYDVSLIMRILQGHREKIVPGTPTDYSDLYTGKI